MDKLSAAERPEASHARMRVLRVDRHQEKAPWPVRRTREAVVRRPVAAPALLPEPPHTLVLAPIQRSTRPEAAGHCCAGRPYAPDHP
jgi:hypothetical protein